MLKLTYTSLIRSHLEYCSSLLIPLAKTHQIRLETIQKIASRIICRAPRNAHSAPLLAELNLHSLLIRRNSHACQIVRNSLEGHCHPACAEWFSVTDEGVVQTVGAPLTAHGRKTFKYAAANLFNEQLRLTLNRWPKGQFLSRGGLNGPVRLHQTLFVHVKRPALLYSAPLSSARLLPSQCCPPIQRL
jgi:hypothetical protein